MIRLAQPSDVGAIADLQVRSWRAAYRGHMAQSFLDSLDPSKRALWWTRVLDDPEVTVLVAVRGSAVVGFSSLRVSSDEDASPHTGEIATLYVDPDYWRSGCGAALVGRIRELARERAFLKLSLWVLSSNAGARAFYEAVGFSADGHEKTDSRLGVPLHEVRYVRSLSSLT